MSGGSGVTDSSSLEHEGQPDERISALVNEFFDRRQAGEDLTPERFAHEHPEAVDDLQPYLKGLALFDQSRLLASGAPSAKVSVGATDLPVVEGYDIIEEIGRGGMGVVYRALQVSTKRIVALKVMLGGPFASPSARRRFDREVELAARLKHQSIVRVLESGDVAGQCYYAMDYIDGIRLDGHLSTSQPDVRSTLSLFVQVCEAVEYAHRHGVVHRDLKPANVVIDDEGNPHILDFGLAKATDQADTEEALTTCVSLPGQVLGTLAYLSPEQAAGTPDQVNARTDVYALGVMLFEGLTGSLPFDMTGRPSQVIQRILETPPTRPSALSDRVDGELEMIILKALEKEEARRYQSASDMAEDIRRYLAGEPILARRPSRLYVLRKMLHKHRWRVVLGTAAAVLALVGLSAGMWWRQQHLAGACQRALKYQQELESGAGSRALGLARTLYARYPRPPEASLVWAQAQYRNQETRDSAILFLERALKHHPSRWACRALLAEICRATGDEQRADLLQARVEREAPDTAEAWYLRSFATLELGRALRCAEQAAQREPSHVLAWQRLTWLRMQTGDLVGALEGAEQLVELGQNAAEWTVFKGRVLARQGRFLKAIDQYTRVTMMGDARQTPRAYLYRAHAYRRIREYDKAVADYTWLVEAPGKKTPAVWYLYQRATPLWILGRTDEALEDYRQVRIRRGGAFYSDARQYLILHEQGRQNEAKQVLDAALRDVENPSWLRQIFRCLAGELGPDELVAEADVRGDLEQLCEAYYYAGEVCLLAGDRAGARQWFERCVQTGIEFDPDTAPGTPMNEYELAHWRLDSLFAADHPTSRP